MDDELEALRRKFFPRVPWDEEKGPVRRVYLARGPGDENVIGVLSELAAREGFTAPGHETIVGDDASCLAAFRRKAAGDPVGMIFGTAAAAYWCDIAAEAPDGEGWQRLTVRSEEGENLTALAYNEGLLGFRRAE